MFNKSFQKLSKSFTLLEILVVIGIIMVLVGIMTVSYSTAQKKSRDAKRKTDLNAIQNAMEQYYSICGYKYPAPVSGIVPTIGCSSPATVIMPVIPKDPRTTTPYPMTQVVVNADYSICTPTVLESESSTPCVTNQQ